MLKWIYVSFDPHPIDHKVISKMFPLCFPTEGYILQIKTITHDYLKFLLRGPIHPFNLRYCLHYINYD